MKFFYNIGIGLYGFAIQFVALFNLKAKLWVAGRKQIFEKISNALSKETRPVIWIHCSSLGEFEQGRPIIESLHRDLKTHALVLTFFSPSGFEIRKDYDQADYVFYLPLDTPRNVKKFLGFVKPTLAVFVKYEFWLNYLNEIKKREIPAVLMSAKFRNDQLFFKSYGKFYRKSIFAFEHIFVQNEESRKLLNNIGYSQVSVAGDTRFDRVAEIAGNAKQFSEIQRFVGGGLVVIAGSTWEKDEDIIADFFNRHPDEDLKLILAPHEINQRHLEQIKRKFKETVFFYTEMRKSVPAKNVRILVVDTIGMLSSVYQYGSIAYIGGGFGKGIHNVLEPATFGMPVIFGTNYQKFSEAVDLIRLKGGFSIKNKTDLDEIISKFM
ncbi:MAG: 3-deoxy-D-manno-octulosonic acid transferase, partial [Bacteroidales bacterium]|nr:3-deoxy-D-manno-octulosonic acid transferase [Bacteroidales bacterium]